MSLNRTQKYPKKLHVEWPKRLEVEWVGPDETKTGKPLSAGERQQS